MKLAYFGYPHTGGTWTVFVMLREGLARHGIKVVWLASGTKAAAGAAEPHWAAERESGTVVSGDTDDGPTRARALAAHIAAEGIDGVFVNVLAGAVETNLARYLDPAVLRVMIVHNITPGTYAAARAVRDHVHATVGVSPRIRDDLVAHRGFDTGHTRAIANGIDVTPFQRVARAGAEGGPLRLLFLGRIKDQDKGVFWLPPIMAALAHADVRLTIAGDGPDLDTLRRRMAPFGERVEILGRVAPDRVPELAAGHDLLVFPSRFEGLPLSLVEAMAAGCVPVATRLRGVTDHVVEDGASGILFPVGDTAAAAAAIAALAVDRARLAAMSEAARRGTGERFAVRTMTDAYAALLGEVAGAPHAIAPSRPWSEWALPRGLKPGLRTLMPTGLKNRLRDWRVRAG